MDQLTQIITYSQHTYITHCFQVLWIPYVSFMVYDSPAQLGPISSITSVSSWIEISFARHRICKHVKTI